MAHSMFNNFPFQFWSIIFIIAGTVLGALGSARDNKTITGLLEQNKEWSKKMDDKVDENSKLTENVKSISDSIELISKENKQILKENSLINEEVNRISKKTEQITKNTAELVANINSNTEAIKFFNGLNFTYLKEVFPKGFTVFRQNKNSENFKKVYGEKLFYEQFDVEIIEVKNGEFIARMDNIRFMPKHIHMSGGSVTRDKFNPKEFKKCQFINPMVIIPNMLLSILMIDDGYDYTFAVGFTHEDSI